MEKSDGLPNQEKGMEEQVKTFYKKLFAFVAMISVVALGLTIINPVSAATVTPTITNLN